MTPQSPLTELSRFGELVRDTAFLAALQVVVVAVTMLAVIGLWRLAHARALGERLGALRWRLHHTAVATFAAAVASGDVEKAEVMAGRALGSQHRARHLGRAAVASWDEQVILNGTRPDAAAQLRRDGGLVTWCPGVRRLSGTSGLPRRGDQFAVGRCHPLRLTVRSHRWVAVEGLRCIADADGLVLVGQLTLRTAPSQLDPRGVDQVEVWVHVESSSSRRARRVLRRVRKATRAGLRRWAAQQNRPAPRQRRPRRFERGADAR